MHTLKSMDAARERVSLALARANEFHASDWNEKQLRAPAQKLRFSMYGLAAVAVLVSSGFELKKIPITATDIPPGSETIVYVLLLGVLGIQVLYFYLHAKTDLSHEAVQLEDFKEHLDSLRTAALEATTAASNAERQWQTDKGADEATRKEHLRAAVALETAGRRALRRHDELKRFRSYFLRPRRWFNLQIPVLAGLVATGLLLLHVLGLLWPMLVSLVGASCK